MDPPKWHRAWTRLALVLYTVSNQLRNKGRLTFVIERPTCGHGGRILFMFDEGSIAKLRNGLLQFGLRVHHDRAVPGDRLFERLARNQKKSDALVAGLDSDLLTGIEQNERTVAGHLAHKRCAIRRVLFG